VNESRIGRWVGTSAVVAAILMAITFAVTLREPEVVRGEDEVMTQTCGSTAVQFLGFSDALNKSTFGGFAVAELSAITYDRETSNYHAVADRAGPVATHVFTLDIPVGGALGGPSISSVTVLNAPSGVPFNGLSFDGEGIDLGRGGEFIVASEGGSAAGEQPEVRRFARDGTHLENLAVPAKFLIGTNNLSFESLSVSPNGHSLFTAVEGPLAADGRTLDLRSRIRILRYEDRGTGGFQPAQEYYYLTEPGRTVGDLGVAEVLALSETEVLVLERGFVANQGNTIRIFHASLKHAQDVSGVASLATTGIAPVSKTLLVDLATCPDGGATIPPGATQANALMDNFEAMTLGPRLPGDRRALVLMSDDNGSAIQTTRIVALAVLDEDLVVDDE
jgi:hypothetical protein